MTIPNGAMHGNGRRKRSHAALILACAVVAGVLFVSFLPTGDKRALHTEGRLHYGLHFAVFSLVGFVLLRTVHSRPARLAVIAGAILLGLGIELAEHFAYRGGMEWKDVLIDTIGVFTGTLLWFALDSSG